MIYKRRTAIRSWNQYVVFTCLMGFWFGRSDLLDAQRRLPAVVTPQLAGMSPHQNIPDTPTEPIAWWNPIITKPLFKDRKAVSISLDNLLAAALIHSAQIEVFKDIPLIKETAIMNADAAFDWTPFVESRWNDVREPVGSILTTDQPFYEDHDFSSKVGIRRRNTLGADVEISQQFGHQQTNSQFFQPGNQGTARLTLGFTQPLLRGAGRVYNTSLTVLAQIDTDVARDELSINLQSHLLEVTRAYWRLYLERGNLLQRQRLLTRAEEILVQLERRQVLDAQLSQVVRARAAVAARKSEIFRAEMAVRNAESKIQALINDPDLGGPNQHKELIPRELPWNEPFPVDVNGSVTLAVKNRPEVNRAMKEIRSAGVRLEMSKNEMLPMLNMVLETYTRGLRGNSNVGGAFVDQYETGDISYSVGLQYEMPIWNRAAKSNLQKRRLELRQLENQFRATIASLTLEVEIAVRELQTTANEVELKQKAMVAAVAEVDQLSDQWKLIPGDTRSASGLLIDLLDSQERLTVAEFEYLDAELSFSLAKMTYRQAVGTLLESEGISVDQFCECYLPRIDLQKNGRVDLKRFKHHEEKPVEQLPPREATAKERDHFGFKKPSRARSNKFPPHKAVTAPASRSVRMMSGNGNDAFGFQVSSKSRNRNRATTKEGERKTKITSAFKIPKPVFPSR